MSTMRRENQSALALPGGDHYHREEEIDLGREHPFALPARASELATAAPVGFISR